MAKDVITRFKLETTAFDSKLKQAAKGLSDYSKTATQAKEGFNQFTKANVEAARSLGSMQTSSVKTKDKVKELVAAYNEAARAYNQLSKEQQNSDWAKALAGSLSQLQQRIKDTKQEMQSLNNTTKSTSMFSGLGDKLSGAMQVFAGNLMTKATMEVANLGAEMVGMVQQGVELAKAGEGIRIAFQRLGRGDILDGLRQATHGTVTDLELMKAAVKFNDFRLPLNELGTMLAFAQQKAKDTGQSVDYMVDSIVTGLGRKSLLILDNLGLSATEIRERMKETGDMTTAVGAIIREQMQKAGDYMETAADRAAQANVNLQNKLEEVGRKFAPIEEASTQLWTSMKIGILDVVSGPLARMLNMLTEAGRLKNTMNDMAGGDSNSETDKQIGFLQKTSARNRRKRYDKQIAIYQAEEAKEWRLYRQKKAEYEDKGGYGGGQGTDMYEDHRKKALAWQMFRLNYQQRAQGLLTSNKPLPPSSDTTTVIPTKTGKGGNTTVKELTEEEKLQQQINDLVQQGMTMDEQGRAAQRVKIAALQDQLQTYKDIENELRGIEKKEKAPEMAEGVSGLNQKAIATYQSMLQESMKGMEYGSTDLTQTLANSIDVTTLSNLLTTTMQQGIDMTKMQLADGRTVADLWDEILGGQNIPDKVWEDLATHINEKLAELGIDPIKVNFQTGDISKPVDDGKQLAKNWQLAGTAIQAVGSAMSQIEDPAAKVMGTIAQAIATVALTFAASLKGTFTPWDWIAAAAAGTATMISTISAIHSATGYAEGGMIKGNTYSGDQIMANGGAIGLNAGELVLNKAQQFNLASQLEGDGNQGTTPSRPYVSGEQIYLGLNNYLRRSGRGEIITSR